MTVFDKLNLKDQRRILVVAAPASFEPKLALLAGRVQIDRDAAAADAVSFALAFVTAQAELDRVSETIAARAVGDALLWFAYPKQSSKRYRCDFHRDTGWSVIRAAGFDSVRMVALDEDWSALRFRREAFIKR